MGAHAIVHSLDGIPEVFPAFIIPSSTQNLQNIIFVLFRLLMLDIYM